MTEGHVTLTPLDYDMTRKAVLDEMQAWRFDLNQEPSGAGPESSAVQSPVLRTARRSQFVSPGAEEAADEDQKR